MTTRIFEDLSRYRKKWEYLVPLLGCLSLLAVCAIESSKKFFWNDELLSLYLISDPSFTHMMTAWGDKFNVAPPLYFVLGWLWAQIFPPTELFLRLFSSLTICVSFVAVWLSLRLVYDFWSASIGVLSVFSLSELILFHDAEVRMYGLFAAVCAMALLQYVIINQRKDCSWKTLAVNTLIHSTVVLTHVYGVFYSAALLVAFLIRDRASGEFRLKVYMSVMIGWLSLLPFIGSILNQADNAAKWWSLFSGTELLSIMMVSTEPLPVTFLLSLVIAFLVAGQSVHRHAPERPRDVSRRKAEHSLITVAGTFMLVPIFAWIVSYTIRPMLADRYIIPTIAISWPILIAHLSSRTISPSSSRRSAARHGSISRLLGHVQEFTVLSLTAIFLLYPVYYARHLDPPRLPGAEDGNFGYTDLPVAMEAGHDFLPRFYYSSKPSRYFHILDWETAVADTGSPIATGDYTHLQALNRNYPFINSIQSRDFLAEFNRFLVINEKKQRWFEERIENNPGYKITFLGNVSGMRGSLDLLLVERR